MKHIIRLNSDRELVGTLSPVADPTRYAWDATELIEVYDNRWAFDARLSELQQINSLTKARWNDFQSLMLMNGAYLRIVGFNATTLTLNSALVWTLGEVGTHPERVGDVINTWNAIAHTAKVTAEETESLRKVCVACNMPFSLVDGGFMVAA